LSGLWPTAKPDNGLTTTRPILPHQAVGVAASLVAASAQALGAY